MTPTFQPRLYCKLLRLSMAFILRPHAISSLNLDALAKLYIRRYPDPLANISDGCQPLKCSEHWIYPGESIAFLCEMYLGRTLFDTSLTMFSFGPMKAPIITQFSTNDIITW